MRKAVIGCCLIVLCGCADKTGQRVFDATDNETQLQKRQYQSRVFDTAERLKIMRACIATLQDSGFLIDNADARVGSITATKTASFRRHQTTIHVQEKGKTQTVVRANMQVGSSYSGVAMPVTQPEIYQDFFTALEKSLFLSARMDE